MTDEGSGTAAPEEMAMVSTKKSQPLLFMFPVGLMFTCVMGCVRVELTEKFTKPFVELAIARFEKFSVATVVAPDNAVIL